MEGIVRRNKIDYNKGWFSPSAEKDGLIHCIQTKEEFLKSRQDTTIKKILRLTMVFKLFQPLITKSFRH